jgi:hypothetical protein
MPKNRFFCLNCLSKLNNTGKVCLQWLTKGEITSSFKCIELKTDDLSSANGGCIYRKKHYEQSKHIQCKPFSVTKTLCDGTVCRHLCCYLVFSSLLIVSSLFLSSLIIFAPLILLYLLLCILALSLVVRHSDYWYSCLL